MNAKFQYEKRLAQLDTRLDEGREYYCLSAAGLLVISNNKHCLNDVVQSYKHYSETKANVVNFERVKGLVSSVDASNYACLNASGDGYVSNIVMVLADDPQKIAPVVRTAAISMCYNLKGRITQSNPAFLELVVNDERYSDCSSLNGWIELKSTDDAYNIHRRITHVVENMTGDQRF